MNAFPCICVLSAMSGLISAQTGNQPFLRPKADESTAPATSGKTANTPVSPLSKIQDGFSMDTIKHHLSSWRFNEDAVVQAELLKVFREKHPDLLAGALKSSGNMHNPKVLPLRAKFSECLLMTPTLSAINALLSNKGYTASVANLEKFELQKDNPELPFGAITWLEVQPLADAVNTQKP